MYFDAFAVLPDRAGVRYDLQTREGMSLRPGERGWIVLGDDAAYTLVWRWGAGRGAYAAVTSGNYTRSGQQLTLFDSGACCDGWASATVAGNTLTLSYDDYLDIGFHSIIVEVYQRPTPP